LVRLNYGCPGFLVREVFYSLNVANTGRSEAEVPVLGLVTCILLYFVLHCKTLYARGDTMKTEMLSTRIDHDTKLAFTNVCEDLGLSPSQAIKLFAKAVINYGGIPFELKAKQPNSLTATAIAELESGKGNTAANVDELFNDLNIGKLDDA